MSKDLGFGFDKGLSLNQDNWLKWINQRFHLLMVSERMDESLFMMSRLLCWPLSSLAVPVKNARKKEVKVMINLQLSM